MNRREILRYTAWLTGARVAAPLATAVLAGCSDGSGTPGNSDTPASQGQKLEFFSPADFEQITRVADTLLPRTDSPSASEVAVPQTLDALLGLTLEEDYVTEFRRLWQSLSSWLEQQGFADMATEARETLLSDLETTDNADLAPAREAMVMLKQQVVVLYLTSETIGEEYLNYDPIPGRYQPCIPVEETNNLKWAI